MVQIPREVIVRMLYERGHRDRATVAGRSLPELVDTVKFGPTLAMFGVDPDEFEKPKPPEPKSSPAPEPKSSPAPEPKSDPTPEPKPEPDPKK